MPLQHFDGLLPLVDARQDAVDEIGAIEIADEEQRIAQRELLGDVAPHLPRRGRGVRVNRGVSELVPQQRELAIFRPEIVAPVADAMRLVDRERLRAHPLQQRAESGQRQPFGGNEK